MKLTQFAFAAILVLLMLAGYLTVKSDQEAQNEINQKLLAGMNELARKQANPTPVIVPQPAVPVSASPVLVPVPVPVPTPPVNPAAAAALAAAAAIPDNAQLAPDNDPRMLEEERKVLNLGADDRMAEDSRTLPAAFADQPLTSIQRSIVRSPAIARVKQYAVKEGMLVLDRGTNVGLKPGDLFSLRRKTAAIGRVRVSETIETSECVADIIPNSMPPGMLPEVGDEVIQFDP